MARVAAPALGRSIIIDSAVECRRPGTQVQDAPGARPSSRGFEIWVLWLKRFPRRAIEAIFWGGGGG